MTSIAHQHEKLPEQLPEELLDEHIKIRENTRQALAMLNARIPEMIRTNAPGRQIA